MTFGLYKWPQGRVARYIAAAVLFSYVGYAAYEFYAWTGATPIAGWFRLGAHQVTWGELGAAVVAVAGCLAVFAVAFANPKAGEYLIASEGELRKVYWPKMKPWFSMATELWGSAYVVIAVVVILSLFIFGADFVLRESVGRIFYQKQAQSGEKR